MVEGLNKSCGFIMGYWSRRLRGWGRECGALGIESGVCYQFGEFVGLGWGAFCGYCGMCEWLPYANEMLRIAREKRGGNNDKEEDDLSVLSGDKDEDPFARSDDEGDWEGSAKGDLPSQAVEFLRESIDMEGKKGMVFQKTPVFLGHGAEDERVDIKLGRRMLWS